MTRSLALVLVVAIPLLALGPWAAGASLTPGRGPARRPVDAPRRRRRPSRLGSPRRNDRAARRGRGAGRRPAVVVVAAGSAVLAAAMAVPWPVLFGVVVLVVAGRARLVAVRRERARRARERAAPDLVDLLAVAAAAGHPPHRCLQVVVERAPPPVAGPVQASCRRLDRGVPLAVAIDELRRGIGALGDPVADALVDAFRTGAPLQPALSRVAAVARDRRRRAAEAEARRLPVLLLFPLVCCVLPAFGLLAVVPLVAASVRSLG